MTRVPVVAILALAALAGPALAQAAMGAAEARRTFFGMDMQGVHEPTGIRWRECIDRQGKTTFWFGETIDEGRLTVRGDGALCFSYASSGFRDNACWRIHSKGGGNYSFSHVDGDRDVFVTTATRRVRQCEGPAPAIS